MVHTKTLDGGYHYLEAGQGEPVVLLHGIASSLHSWQDLMPSLAARGFRAFALDMLGHGNSYKPENPEAYSIQGYYRHFLDWLELISLNGDRLSIIAHSMGAYLALLFAREHPEQLRRIVLLDPFYKPDQMSWGLKMSARRPKLSASIMRATPGWLAYPMVRYSPQVAKEIPTDKLDQMARDYARVHPNIVYTAPSTRDLTDQLPKIKTQALVIWGEKDPTLDPTSYPELVEALPDARGKSIPKTGHMPHLARLDEVQREVLAFLNEA